MDSHSRSDATWSLFCEFWTLFFLLKCLIQLDQRIQYQNAVARNLAHFLNSPQQGEAPSAWISNSTLSENDRLQSSTLVVWGENPVTVWTLCFLYIDVIQIVATVVESANTDGKLLGPILTVNINCWEAVFTVIFIVFAAEFTVINNCLPVAAEFTVINNCLPVAVRGLSQAVSDSQGWSLHKAILQSLLRSVIKLFKLGRLDI